MKFVTLRLGADRIVGAVENMIGKSHEFSAEREMMPPGHRKSTAKYSPYFFIVISICWQIRGHPNSRNAAVQMIG